MSLKGSFASVLAHFHDVRSTPNGEQTATSINVGFVPIVLQKAKVTGLRIFRENTKAGSNRRFVWPQSRYRSREFSAERWGPRILTRKSHLQPTEFL